MESVELHIHDFTLFSERMEAVEKHQNGDSSVTINGKNAAASNGMNGTHAGAAGGEHEEMQYLNLIRKIIDSGTFTNSWTLKG